MLHLNILHTRAGNSEVYTLIGTSDCITIGSLPGPPNGFARNQRFGSKFINNGSRPLTADELRPANRRAVIRSLLGDHPIRHAENCRFALVTIHDQIGEFMTETKVLAFGALSVFQSTKKAPIGSLPDSIARYWHDDAGGEWSELNSGYEFECGRILTTVSDISFIPDTDFLTLARYLTTYP